MQALKGFREFRNSDLMIGAGRLERFKLSLCYWQGYLGSALGLTKAAPAPAAPQAEKPEPAPDFFDLD